MQDVYYKFKCLSFILVLRKADQQSLAVVVVSQMFLLSFLDLLSFCSSIASFIPYFLEKAYTTKEIQLLVSVLWIKLNTVIPRRYLFSVFICKARIVMYIFKYDALHNYNNEYSDSR